MPVIDAVLSDNGREFCGREDQHPDELFLQLEGIVHKTTRVGRPQSNGIVERLHRTLLDEHLRVQGRTVWHETVDEMQTALDAWLLRYNRERPHQGRGMNGRTPLQAFIEGLPANPTVNQETKPQPIRRLNPTIPRGAAAVRSTPLLYILRMTAPPRGCGHNFLQHLGLIRSSIYLSRIS